MMEGKEEKTKAAEELVRSRNEILITLDSIGDAVISTDSKGNIIFMNPVAEDLTGWKEEESVGKNIKEIFHIVNEETGDEVENPVTKVLKDGLIAGLANHTILIAKDGSRIPIDDSGAPIKDEEGNILGVVLIFRDITERRKAEKEIQQKTLELDERVKELNCLYGISSLKIIPDITIDEFLTKAIELLPPSWQYPEITTARIIFEGKEFKTANFRESSWKQSAEIKLSRKKAGMIEVYYLKEKPESYEGPFLKEERDLINSLAESIGAFLHIKLQKDQEEKERKKAEQELKQTIDLSLDFI
ncbi:MAG: PAS domain S-box protein, partial [Candidatus Heimdallarchaeota archaeon]|nr:PAS domain S-box protein [Candidatus Heimdallarchaeota archaeon]